MTTTDYAPLLEKIRTRIKAWTVRPLSYAGRLQLIRSVLMSIVNFWSAAYRLPGACIRDIESLCSAFLWSGPELNTHKAKIAWSTVTTEIREGGLGLKKSKDTNKVSGLKLVWRIVSKQNTMWVKWIYMNHLRQEWSVKNKETAGSWMWRKLLKLRDLAKTFHRVEIYNGRDTSFWYDHWSPFGRLIDMLGDRGYIDLGIKKHASVAEAIRSHTRRRHRVVILNNIEDFLEQVRANARENEEDVHKWKHKPDEFKKKFSSKLTWNFIREEQLHVGWNKLVWFTYATPKYAFLTWIAMHNRLATGDRIAKWSQHFNASCVLCTHQTETKNHLFFDCPYSSKVWELLVKGILFGDFSTEWDDLMGILKDPNNDRTKQLILRYTFQATIHALWQERNGRKHGEEGKTPTQMVKMVDKNVRNRLSSIRIMGDTSYEESLMVWFSSRI